VAKRRRKGGLEPAELTGLRLALWLSLAGYILGGYLVLNHFGVSDAGFCKVGDISDCDLVNRSQYSSILGVPVALMGAAGFVAVAFFATARLVDAKSWLGRFARPALSAATVGGIFVGIYLTMIEVFVLNTLCLLCVASFALFLVVAYSMRRTLLLPWRKGWKTPPGKLPAERG
jgi:uncharacterized membrane protein